ncbi:unnamed protein product [Dicrocoelium dendriticum]|nr:unnamed protein product [Dicrocoelium dendriticum]
MDPTSVFYDKDANIATSECSEGEAQFSETTRLPLGGVFQKCHGPSELCNTLTVVNPATGNFTCSPGYFEVRLVAAQVRSCYNQCHRSIWGTPLQCHQECAVTESFWCSQNPSLPDAPEVDEDFGFMFAGLYTDKEPNSITHRFSCPEYSWPIAVGRKMRICLSADRELAGKYGIPFGGFYSCRDGNPLVTVLDRNETSPEGRKAFQKLLTQLNHFVTHQGRPILPRNDSRAQRMSEYQHLLAPIWPKRCPKGYTSHLASMEDACQINFCVPANRLKRTRKRYLKRPPFVDPPSFYEGSNPVSTVMKSKTIPNSLPGPHGEQLERVDGVWVRKGSMSSGTAETKLRNERIITIILGCIIAVLCAAMLAVVVPTIVHKRKITRLIPS